MKRKPLAYALKTGAALLVFAVVMLGAPHLLDALFGRLVAAWGITDANLHLAPGWTRVIAGQYATWADAARYALLIPLSLLLARVLYKRPLAWGRGAAWLLFGLVAGVLWVALLRLIDAVRFGWSLAQPRIGTQMFAPFALYAARAVGGEALFRGVLLAPGDAISEWVAMLVSALAFALLSFAYLPLTLINAALLGLIACQLYIRTRGILTGALARFGLDAVLYGIMGCAGGAAGAPYETYPSQLSFLSGGAAGPMNGLMMTCMLVAVFVLIWRLDRRGVARVANAKTHPARYKSARSLTRAPHPQSREEEKDAN